MNSFAARIAWVIVFLFCAAAHADVPTTQPIENLNDALSIRINITLDGLTFEKFLAQVQDQTHLNLMIARESSNEAATENVIEVAALHGTLEGVTVRQAIQLAATDAGVGDRLTFELRDDVIRIHPVGESITRVFNIGRLMTQLRKEKLTQIDKGKLQELTDRDVLDGLTKLIEDTIEPETWRDAGGAIGSVKYFADRIIVTQTSANLERIKALLISLEKSDAK